MMSPSLYAAKMATGLVAEDTLARALVDQSVMYRDDRLQFAVDVVVKSVA